MILRPSILQPQAGRWLRNWPPQAPLLHRAFRASRPIRAEALPNHYEALDLDTNASPGDVKKQFYKLSKTHHPDHNPDDPQAATRFMRISEAYGVLGSADKRARYDRDFLRTIAPHQQQSQQRYPSGSHSSHSTPAGGRPATGLSRRRTQFKGPPPSFYRSGGWGSFGEKRSEHASRASHAHETAAGAAAGAAAGRAAQDVPPGTGPAGFTQGLDNDVPHFDRDGHFRTHESVERARHRARRRQAVAEEMAGGSGPSMLFNFFLLSGVLTVIFGVTGALFRGGAGDARRRSA
ncbi:hypothetical protein MBLNU459_g5644t1 [Dothideomycetes sp. NU459]